MSKFRNLWFWLTRIRFFLLSAIGRPVRVIGTRRDWLEFAEFYARWKDDIPVASSPSGHWADCFAPSAVVSLVSEGHTRVGRMRLPGHFRCSPSGNPKAAWEACEVSEVFSKELASAAELKRDLVEKIVEIKKTRLKTAYIFGTGPSLGRSVEYDWSHGYRIACNTIVKSSTTWNHLKPHVIVAGDALYHFSITEHAMAFRSDLKQRLREHPAIFAYPAKFQAIVVRELQGFEDLLLPVPDGRHHTLHQSIDEEGGLPIGLGNVLNLMLLPFACSLAKDVRMIGFDGRRPDDKLFWSYSNEHAYPDLITKMKNQYTAFFDREIPEGDQHKYIRINHGQALEDRLCAAESHGWVFKQLFQARPSHYKSGTMRPLGHQCWSAAIDVPFTVHLGSLWVG